MYDVIVVGGGASGMTAAIFAAKRQLSVLIIDHKERLGKKILATGNGKCNYTNLYQEQDCYRGQHPEFAMEVLRQFDQNQTIAFFRSLGIEPKIKQGYVYPYSLQAQAVTQVLMMELKRLRVKISLSNHISSVEKKDSIFLVSTKNYTYEGKSVVLATGGCASQVHGSDGSGYKLAKMFGHRVIEPFPALVQLKTKQAAQKDMSGVRLEASAQLYCNQKLLAKQNGEFLFTDYGISGIPILQMSRFASDKLKQFEQVELVLDYFPDMTTEELMQMLQTRANYNKTKTLEEFFTGILPAKAIPNLIQRLNESSKTTLDQIDDRMFAQMVSELKNDVMTITGTTGFEQAQVSAGGVDTSQVNPKTMESLIVNDLYMTGELLDIDGTCGGYNLQFAWSSGATAGNAIRKRG